MAKKAKIFTCPRCSWSGTHDQLAQVPAEGDDDTMYPPVMKTVCPICNIDLPHK